MSTRRVLSWVSVCFVTAACHQPTASDLTDAGSGLGDAGSSQDAGAPYQQGTYWCCPEGNGLACCAAKSGLLGIGLQEDGGFSFVGDRSLTSANCFQYGGTSGACTAEGQTLERKDICSICCPGLAMLDTYCGGADPDCVVGLDGAPSLKVCTRCGDGTCGTGESNRNYN